MKVLFGYMLLVHIKKICSQIKRFLYFLNTPWFCWKGYTYDVFWTLLLSCRWRTCWSASSKSWPVQCPRSCSGTQGVRWKSYTDFQADLQLQESCSCRSAWWFHITLYFIFWIFLIKILLAISPMFFICFSIFFLTAQYECEVLRETRFFQKKSSLPPLPPPNGEVLKKYMFFEKRILST